MQQHRQQIYQWLKIMRGRGGGADSIEVEVLIVPECTLKQSQTRSSAVTHMLMSSQTHTGWHTLCRANLPPHSRTTQSWFVWEKWLTRAQTQRSRRETSDSHRHWHSEVEEERRRPTERGVKQRSAEEEQWEEKHQRPHGIFILGISVNLTGRHENRAGTAVGDRTKQRNGGGGPQEPCLITVVSASCCHDARTCGLTPQMWTTEINPPTGFSKMKVFNLVSYLIFGQLKASPGELGNVIHNVVTNHHVFYLLIYK